MADIKVDLLVARPLWDVFLIQSFHSAGQFLSQPCRQVLIGYVDVRIVLLQDFNNLCAYQIVLHCEVLMMVG